MSEKGTPHATWTRCAGCLRRGRTSSPHEASSIIRTAWTLPIAQVDAARATGWHVAVDGDAPLDIDIRFPVPIEQMGDVSPR